MAERPRRAFITWVALSALLAISCGGGDPGEPGAEARVEGPPPEMTAAGDSWPTANGDYAATRAVLDSPITSRTVDGLEVAWEVELPGVAAMGNGATNPLIVGDTVYIGDLTTSVRAFDLATGAEKWAIEEDAGMFGPTGVAVGWGKVFAPSSATGEGRATHITAFDAETGAEVWSTRITEPDGQIDIQPVVFDGQVLASSAGRPAGHRGVLHALDEATGEIVWTFDTIDSDDLWGNAELNYGGGSWYPPAIDTDAGVAYWGTGNPYPFPGAPGFPLGSSRPGDNLYANSLLAIDLDDGELLWHHQAVTHDLFDRDSMLTALATLPDGRQVVVNSGKHGRILGFDTATHELLYDTPVGMHQNDDVTDWEGELEVLPGGVGGVETPMASADGVLFASVVNAPSVYQPDVASSGFEVQLGTFDSQLVAVDLATGAIVWDVPLGGDSFGGATVVGDLVLTSLFSGRILAFDRATGAEVWSHQVVDGGINGWPAVAGDTIVFPIGLGPSAKLIAFRLP